MCSRLAQLGQKRLPVVGLDSLGRDLHRGAQPGFYLVQHRDVVREPGFDLLLTEPVVREHSVPCGGSCGLVLLLQIHNAVLHFLGGG